MLGIFCGLMLASSLDGCGFFHYEPEVSGWTYTVNQRVGDHVLSECSW
jgi:hypothetical protein